MAEHYEVGRLGRFRFTGLSEKCMEGPIGPEVSMLVDEYQNIEDNIHDSLWMMELLFSVMICHPKYRAEIETIQRFLGTTVSLGFCGFGKSSFSHWAVGLVQGSESHRSLGQLALQKLFRK